MLSAALVCLGGPVLLHVGSGCGDWCLHLSRRAVRQAAWLKKNTEQPSWFPGSIGHSTARGGLCPALHGCLRLVGCSAVRCPDNRYHRSSAVVARSTVCPRGELQLPGQGDSASASHRVTCKHVPLGNAAQEQAPKQKWQQGTRKDKTGRLSLAAPPAAQARNAKLLQRTAPRHPA